MNNVLTQNRSCMLIFPVERNPREEVEEKLKKYNEGK